MKVKEKGFSLVEVLIAVGLAGGLSVVIAKLMDQQIKVSKAAEVSGEINTFTARMSSIISSQSGCYASLAVYQVPVKMNGDPIEITKIYSSTNGNPSITTGDMISSKLQLSKIEIMVKPNEFDYSNAQGVGEVEFTISKVGNSGYGASEIKRRVPFRATFGKYNSLSVVNSVDYSQAVDSAKNDCKTKHGFSNDSDISVIDLGSIGTNSIFKCIPTSPLATLFVEDC